MTHDNPEPEPTADTMKSLIKGLSDQWRALTALAGAMAVGGAIALSTVAFTGLPAQVREHTDSIRSFSRQVGENRELARRVSGQYERIICLLTLPGGTSPLEAQRECP